MICEKCGNWVEDGASSCPGCGFPVMTGASNGVSGAGAKEGGMFNGNPSWSGYEETKLTRMGFYRHPNVSTVRKQIRGCGMAMYLLAVINAVLYITTGDVLSGIVSIVFMVGLGLGIHLLQSRICAIALTVFGGYNMVMTSMITGKPSGWLFLLVGVYGIIYTFKFHKAWKQYKNTGIVPFTGGK